MLLNTLDTQTPELLNTHKKMDYKSDVDIESHETSFLMILIRYFYMVPIIIIAIRLFVLVCIYRIDFNISCISILHSIMNCFFFFIRYFY